ncbi:hypothetical protein ACP70R_037456 [Stipagrostis hirtigluma subsp. patula]
MMSPPARTTSRGPAAEDDGNTDDGPAGDRVHGVIDAEMDLFQSSTSSFGHSGRDLLFYKKRCGRDIASLEMIDFDIMCNRLMHAYKVWLANLQDEQLDTFLKLQLVERSFGSSIDYHTTTTNNSVTNIPSEAAATPPPQFSVRRTRVSNVN